jgi:hypothetical protein
MSNLEDVAKRFRHAEIGKDLYIGVEAWPRGAWSVQVPPEGREIFEAWIRDLEAALSPQDGVAATKRWEVGKDGWDAADEMTREDI